MVEAVRESTPSDLNWGPTLEDFFRRMRARLGSSQGVVDELNEFLCDGDWRLAVRHVDAGGKETRGVLLPEFWRHEARLFWEPNANGFDQIAAYYPAGGWVELVDSLGAAVKICLLDGDTEFIGRHSDLESWEVQYPLPAASPPVVPAAPASKPEEKASPEPSKAGATTSAPTTQVADQQPEDKAGPANKRRWRGELFQPYLEKLYPPDAKLPRSVTTPDAFNRVTKAMRADKKAESAIPSYDTFEAYVGRAKPRRRK